jgi:hypothetical protein
VIMLSKLFGSKKVGTENTSSQEIRNVFMMAQEALKTPWAMFEIAGFEEDGKIRVEFNWNAAFIKQINELGFHAESEEDAVQLFFFASQMQPHNNQESQPVQSEATPFLSENSSNKIIR